jgi:hypothetical protein
MEEKYRTSKKPIRLWIVEKKNLELYQMRKTEQLRIQIQQAKKKTEDF